MERGLNASGLYVSSAGATGAGVALGKDNKLTLQSDGESEDFTVDSDWRPLSFSQIGLRHGCRNRNEQLRLAAVGRTKCTQAASERLDDSDRDLKTTIKLPT